MSKSYRRGVVIIILDLLIALFAFWISRYFGDLPRWYWLVLSGVIWVGIGLVTNKLYFSQYKRLRYVFGGLFVIDIITGGLLFMSYRYFIADYHYDYSILLATGIIYILECVLYYCLRLFVYRKIPYFYEKPITNKNVESIKNIEVERCVINKNVNDILKAMEDSVTNPINVISTQLLDNSVILDSSNPETVLQHRVKSPTLIVHNIPLNMVMHINTLLSFTNYKLENYGYVVCKCVTSGIRRDRIMQQNPKKINSLMCFLDYIIHRVIPKLKGVKRLYYWITKGERRALTRVEVLGRLYRAGFDVVCEKVISGKLYVVAKKIKEPIRDDKPSNGLLIRLKRTGKNAKTIGVYKFRTMHTYSEYLQPYMYKTEGLAKDGGRYGNDYRVSASGNFMRKVFIDELPMLINWIKGDLKLVGVRPLSSHYFSLYSKELQELRIKVTPGLLPPFYADKPKSLEEKQESEMRYLNAYLKNPIRTDWVYFWRIFESIVFRGTRSE